MYAQKKQKVNKSRAVANTESHKKSTVKQRIEIEAKSKLCKGSIWHERVDNREHGIARWNETRNQKNNTSNRPKSRKEPQQSAWGPNNVNPVQRIIKIDGDTYGREIKEKEKGLLYFIFMRDTTGSLHTSVLEDLTSEELRGEYKNYDELVDHYESKIEKPGRIQRKEETYEVLNVKGEIVANQPIKIKPGDQIVRRLHDYAAGLSKIYKVNYSGNDYIMKSDVGGSGIAGMREMKEAGIRVPSTVRITLSDNNDYILMSDLESEGLTSGLQNLNDPMIPDEMLYNSGMELGRIHIIDLFIGNNDRLPWRGNNYVANYHNIFSVFTGQIIGLDSDYQWDRRNPVYRDAREELEEITDQPKEYAKDMIYRISIDEKSRWELNEEKQRALAFGYYLGMRYELKRRRDLYQNETVET